MVSFPGTGIPTAAMIKPKRPQRGDVVIIRTVDGLWTHRQLDDSHIPDMGDTLQAAVASGGLIADFAQVDLWLMDDDLQYWVLVTRRRVSEPDHGAGGLPARHKLSKRRLGGIPDAYEL